MFAGFNLRIEERDIGMLSGHGARNFYLNGQVYKEKLQREQEDKVRKNLDRYIRDDGALSASKMEEDWFPVNLGAHVFLSHSHDDERLVLGLAAWLKDCFELTPFVDSCVWGFANELLREINDKYCRRPDGTYDYDETTRSASLVYMLLNNALAKMIDSTECLIFINTPSSLTPSQAIKQPETHSPWIYSELWFSKMVRPQEHRQSKVIQESAIVAQIRPPAAFPVPLNHLYDLNAKALANWRTRAFNYKKGPETLDILYRDNIPSTRRV